MSNIFVKPKIFTLSSSSSGAPAPIPVAGVVGNGLLYAVPAGYMVEMVSFAETAGHDVSIDLGTTVAGSEIVSTLDITANGVMNYTCTYNKDTTYGTFNLYISSLAWGGASLDVYIILRKVK